MTTIAYDGLTVAADSMTAWGFERSQLPTRKIRKGEDGCIYAASGSGGLLDILIGWVEAGAKYDDAPKLWDTAEWTLLVIRADGVAFCAMKGAPVLVDVGAPWAIGTGGEFAMGAMLAGKSAYEAVQIASQVDINTGGEVVVVPVPAASSNATEGTP